MTAARGLVGQDARARFGFAHLGPPLRQRQIRDFAVARVEHERVAGQLKPDDQPDRSGEHLRGDVAAVGVELLDHRDRVGPDRIAGVTGRQCERHRQPRVLRRFENLLQHIGITARRDVGHELNQPTATFGHSVGDRGDLRLRRVVGGDQLAAGRLVEREPRRRETERADLDRLLRQLAHPRQVLPGSRLTVGAPLTHHIHPQR